MSKYGRNITSEHSTNEIVKDILKLLKNNDEVFELDFKGVSLVTTSAMKAIFKPIVEEYGTENLFKRIRFCNVVDDLKIIISIAIDSL